MFRGPTWFGVLSSATPWPTLERPGCLQPAPTKHHVRTAPLPQRGLRQNSAACATSRAKTKICSALWIGFLWGKRHQSSMLLARCLRARCMARNTSPNHIHVGTHLLRVLRHEGRSQKAANMVHYSQPKHGHTAQEHSFNEFHTTEVPCKLLLLIYPCTVPATVVTELACC